VIYVHTNIHRGVAPGVLMGSTSAWARSLGCKLNGALGGIVLTCGYAGGFRNVQLGVWGQHGRQRGGGEVRGLVGPIAVMGRLWVGLQASVEYMRYV